MFDEVAKLLSEGLDVGTFEIGTASPDDPLPAGHYWHAPDYRIFRGPFESEEQAWADCLTAVRDLVAVIVVPMSAS
jgi:hypothetical protein